MVSLVVGTARVLTRIVGPVCGSRCSAQDDRQLKSAFIRANPRKRSSEASLVVGTAEALS